MIDAPLYSFAPPKKVRVPKVLGLSRYEALYRHGNYLLGLNSYEKHKSIRSYISPNGFWEKCLLMHDNKGWVYNVWCQPIGQGAEGSVYVGVHLDSGEVLAFKELVHESLSKISTTKRHYYKESAILNALGRRHGVIDNRSQSILIQDFIYGTSLNRFIHDEHDNYVNIFTFEQRLKLAKLIIDEVQRLHDHGLMHRDIKLENIIYDSVTERVCLCDFGFTESLSKLTQCHRGAYLYAAKDNFVENVSVKSEWYSVGVLLAFIFTEHSMQSIFDHLNQLLIYNRKNERCTHRFIASAVPELSSQELSRPERRLWGQLRKMLSEDPDERISLLELKQTIMSIQEMYYPAGVWSDAVFNNDQRPSLPLLTNIEQPRPNYTQSCDDEAMDWEVTPAQKPLLFNGPEQDGWFSRFSEIYHDTSQRHKSLPCTII